MTGLHSRSSKWAQPQPGKPIPGVGSDEEPANGGIRREPTLPEHEAIVSETPPAKGEFALLDDEPDDAAIRAKVRLGAFARQAMLDPDDGLGL